MTQNLFLDMKEQEIKKPRALLLLQLLKVAAGDHFQESRFDLNIPDFYWCHFMPQAFWI